MAAKPRINVRFRADLLERIDALVKRGVIKNMTQLLESGAERELRRLERKQDRNGNGRG